MERRKKVNHGIGADFSRTCEGCGCITVETVAGLPPLFRCNAPGQRRGYTVSAAGRFLPYVPAWCPLMEREGGKEPAMNRKEELLEKIKKIKALADRGVGGEKTTAQATLERLMQEHGITEADLEVERVETVFFPYHDELERRILIQIIFSVTGKPAFGCVGAASGRKRKKYGTDCTAAHTFPTRSHIFKALTAFAMFPTAVLALLAVAVHPFVLESSNPWGLPSAATVNSM